MEKAQTLDLSGLNRTQREAVEYREGASLIIAGAGSGKTRVITYKIAALLESGCEPGAVLALTFTNKAAREMKERISDLVGRRSATRIWMGTFHSIFLRILREYAERIGFPPSFTIYDTTDSRNVVKQCVKELELDEKVYRPADVLARISRAKNNLITAQAYAASASIAAEDQACRKGRTGEVYQAYARKCRAAGAMDFDDILLYMNILLRDHPDVCSLLAGQFRYILVDEYQDTNYSQYLIVKKLSAVHRNLTVVGDDSQSIYAFRGARLENILTFRKDFPEARTFKLEQNYRSTRTIVDAANSVIEHNADRIPKTCFSEGEPGEKIEVIKAFTDQEEGALVASSIKRRIFSSRASYDQFAVLYRTNAQSRTIEECLRRVNLPYKVFAGHSFYERKEIRDVLSYFKLSVNPRDDEAFRRVVNVPARGIGDTTLERLSEAARAAGVSLSEAAASDGLEQYGLKGAAVQRLKAFGELIRELAGMAVRKDAGAAAVDIVNRSGYTAFLNEDKSIEGQSRRENVEELLNSVGQFVSDVQESAREEDRETGPEDVSMGAYLSNVSLISDLDVAEDGEEDDNRIRLMTVHSSKGLEFPYVYLIGMEENLFPSLNSMSGESEVEEERRLFYVGMTRAMKGLAVSFAKSRFRWGEYVNYPPSRFLREIAPQFLDKPVLEEQTFPPSGSPARPAGGRSGGSAPARTGGTVPLRPSGTGDAVRRNAPAAGRPLRPVSAGPSRPSASVPSAGAGRTASFRSGQRVEHERFGLGVILSLEGTAPDEKAVVRFDVGGTKTLLLKYARLRAVD